VEQAQLEDKMIGENLPGWTIKESRIESNRLYYIGFAEMSADKNDYYIAKAALMDAEVKLISVAPSDFRVLTQNVLSEAGIDSSAFNQIQTKLQELVGLTSVEPHQYTCRKFVKYGETTSRITKACWYEASVNLGELRKAINMTLRKKYGDEKTTKFDDLMQKELDNINNLDRFNSKAEVKNENKTNPLPVVVSDQQ
jgi:hypothetical protein